MFVCICATGSKQTMTSLVLHVRLPDPLLNLAAAILLTSYMFYGFARVPPDADRPDDLFWTYAKGKVVHRLSGWGELLGLGHAADLYRSMTSYLEDPACANRTTEASVNRSDLVWDGVHVRVYEPVNKMRNGPGIVFFHGGLWFMGTLDKYDSIACEFAKSLGVIVVSVDYRLAPENPYPLPLDDCYLAVCYFLHNGHQFHVDTSRVALIGIEAGANIAAAVALKLRDRGRHMPEYQVLINPVLQCVDFLTPSYDQYQYDAACPGSLLASAWLWYGLGPAAHLRYGAHFRRNQHTAASAARRRISGRVDRRLVRRRYLPEGYSPAPGGRADEAGDDSLWAELEPIVADPYFAPLMADSLRALPPAYVVVSQHDVARDDGVIYARRLALEGVEVSLKHYPGAVHGQVSLCPRTVLGQTIITDAVQYLMTKL